MVIARLVNNAQKLRPIFKLTTIKDMQKHFSIAMKNMQPFLFVVKMVRDPLDYTAGEIQLRSACHAETRETQLIKLWFTLDIEGYCHIEKHIIPESRLHGGLYSIRVRHRTPSYGIHLVKLQLGMAVPVTATVKEEVVPGDSSANGREVVCS